VSLLLSSELVVAVDPYSFPFPLLLAERSEIEGDPEVSLLFPVNVGGLYDS